MYEVHKRSGFSKGKNWTRTIVLWGIVVAVAYGAILFVPAIWRNHQVSTALNEAGNNAYREKKEDVLKDAVKRRVRNDTSIVVNDDQIEFAWGASKESVTIVLRYEEVVRFWPFPATVVLKFSPTVSKDLTRIRWEKKGCG